MKTFIENFTIERISVAWKLLTYSFALALIIIPFSILVSKLSSNDTYIQKIYTYGLTFSNFSFMGNAIVSSLFEDILFEYLIFTLALWILIYLWGVSGILLFDSDKKTIKERMKSFLNPVFMYLIIGMIIRLFQISMPGGIEYNSNSRCCR